MKSHTETLLACKSTFTAIMQIVAAPGNVKIDGQEMPKDQAIIMQAEAAVRGIEAHLKAHQGQSGPPPGTWIETDEGWRYDSNGFAAEVDKQNDWCVINTEAKVVSKGDAPTVDLAKSRAVSILKMFVNGGE